MSTTTAFLKRHSLSMGILLMFLFTWPIDLAYSGMLPFQVLFIVYPFLGWGFVAASVLMSGLTLGKDAVFTLLKRYLYWQVGWKWFLVAFLLEPLLMLLGVYGNAWVTGAAPDYGQIMAYQTFGESATLWLFIVPFFLIDFICNGEDASSNTAGIFLPMANTVSGQNMGAYIGYVLLDWAVALVIVLVTGPARLSRTQAKQVQGDPDRPALEPVLEV